MFLVIGTKHLGMWIGRNGTEAAYRREEKRIFYQEKLSPLKMETESGKAVKCSLLEIWRWDSGTGFEGHEGKCCSEVCWAVSLAYLLLWWAWLAGSQRMTAGVCLGMTETKGWLGGKVWGSLCDLMEMGREQKGDHSSVMLQSSREIVEGRMRRGRGDDLQSA